MPSISLRAIKNNRNLSGAGVKLREGIAASCATYNPSTDDDLTKIADTVGMTVSHASRVLKELSDKGETASDDSGRIYLLRLDDYQLEEIAKKDEKLLKKLAELGCVEAQKLVDDMSRKVDLESTSNRFLFHFFLFSQLTHCQEKLTYTQPPVDISSTKVDISSTPLKELNGFNGFLNGFNGKEEEESPSSSSSPKSDNSDETKTQVPQSGEGKTNGKKTRKAQVSLRESGSESGKSKGRGDLKTRPDLEKDEDWLVWLKGKPENKGIAVTSLYNEMLKWCRKKGVQPSRKRLLNWLDRERDSVPIDPKNIKEDNEDGSANSNGCGDDGYNPFAGKTVV